MDGRLSFSLPSMDIVDLKSHDLIVDILALEAGWAKTEQNVVCHVFLLN